MMSKKQNLYTAQSGMSAVQAMFLFRGYNARPPVVDVGEDLFVIRDSDKWLWCVQVKSSITKGKGTRRAGQFSIPMAQLEKEHVPDLFYVLAAFRNGLWRDFLVIPRKRLFNLHRDDGIGNVVEGKLILYIAFSDSDAVCSGVSLLPFRDDWSEWPEIAH